MEPILEKVSVTRFHVGTLEQATVMKLAMNLQISGISQALCEALTLTRGAEIDDDHFFEVMKVNAAWSGLAELKEPKLRSSDYSPQFSIKNLHKDMRLTRLVAPCKLPQLECSIDCLAAAEEAGYANEDFISLIRMLER